MLDRISARGKPTKLVNLGPANGRVWRDAWVRRLSIDEALALAVKKR